LNEPDSNDHYSQQFTTFKTESLNFFETLKCSVQNSSRFIAGNISSLPLISALHLKYCFFDPRSAALNLIFFEGSLTMKDVWRKVIPHQF
jgi:hypothetical protein